VTHESFLFGLFLLLFCRKTQTFLDKKVSEQHIPFLKGLQFFFLKGALGKTNCHSLFTVTQLVIDPPPRTPQTASYAAEPGSSFGPRAKRTLTAETCFPLTPCTCRCNNLLGHAHARIDSSAPDAWAVVVQATFVEPACVHHHHRRRRRRCCCPALECFLLCALVRSAAIARKHAV
jgi:hypothetical protein